MSIIILSVFILALGVGYIWFVHNSKSILINLFNERSGGRLKLKLAEATFDFINSDVNIREASITSTDKDNGPTRYQVRFRKIKLHTNSIWSLLFHQSLEIKEIKAYDPVIDVYNNHVKNNADSINQLSIGAELGKIYNSIEEGISTLHTHSIYVINAKLVLHTTVPGKEPIVLSNIYFTLKKLNKYRNQPGEYFEKNNIDFSSSNQDIMLSDGIHKLIFKKLSIIEARSIILDSCTIIGLPATKSGNSYSISFKKLALVGVDFNALDKKNIIRADSVYCEVPITNINLNSLQADSNKASKGLPDIENIIKTFSGNLDLGFVGVMNADIHLNVKGKKSLSNFHSGKVNFQIRNLRINPDSSKLVSVKSFDMMVKGYQLYNADSTSIFSFDSVRFSNDKLLLNNFSVHTVSGKNKARNYRDYNVHYFALLGINWSELIFDQYLTASEAILYDPVINFKKDRRVEISKKSMLFNSTYTFDDFMAIDKLKIVNGTINVDWGVNNSLQLNGLNLGLLGKNFTDIKHVRLYNDVETLSFNNGLFKIGDINAQLKDVVFDDNNQLHAGEVLIKNNSGQIDSKIEDVTINTIYSEKNNKSFVVDGLLWRKGAIKVDVSAGAKKQHHRNTSVLLQNVQGKQTSLQIIKNDNKVDAFINDVQIQSIFKDYDGPVEMKGLQLAGEKLNFANAATVLRATAFNLDDNKQELKDAVFQQNSTSANLIVTIPSVQLKGSFNKYFSNNIHLKNIVLQSPDINFRQQHTLLSLSKKLNNIPSIKIDHINISEPVMNLLLQDSLSATNILLPYSKASKIEMDDVAIDSDNITAGGFNLQSGRAACIKGDEKVVDIDGNINVSLQKINYPIAVNSTQWQAFLTTLSLRNSKGFTFNVKENQLTLKDIFIGNVSLNSDDIKNPVKLLTASPNASVSTSSAKYITKHSLWHIDNVNYNGNKKELELDSINYHPLLSRDSAIASSPYQTDYIYFNSGKTLLAGMDLDKLLNENSLSVQTADFNHPYINVYRDKFPPLLPNIRKKLFTEQIKNIDQELSINKVSINDGKVSYTERNAKSRLDGNLLLAHLNGNISNIKNYQLQAADSLSINIAGRLLDTAQFDIKIHQSYQDSLYGFRLNLDVDPVALSVLNALLAPLSNVKFVAGYLDNFQMNAIGNENVAWGKMKFYYHDMHIKLLKKGGTEKTKLLKSTESNLVNFFYVKNNNRSRTGLIYFERLKDHSFFNYINKIIFSGIGTSIGAHNNRKYERLYRKNDLKF
ncbi:MAG TPA: hypothetical protein VIJ92_09575 [Ginsengibacter sp.]